MQEKFKKRGEFGFIWIFAIISGIILLLLAIYGAIEIAKPIPIQNGVELSTLIGILTDPLEAGFTESTFSSIHLSQNTTILVDCNTNNEFGESIITAFQEDKKNETEKYIPIKTKEKYIFAMETQTEKEFHLWSKSFNFPYKFSDYIIILPKSTNYCFFDTPDTIKSEITSLKIPIIFFENCSEKQEMITVCFNNTSCDINVKGNCKDCKNKYETGTITTKNNKNINYTDSLLFPAIFSSKKIYECNVNRLLYRGNTVSKILANKAAMMNARDCSTNIREEIINWGKEIEQASAKDIIRLSEKSTELNKKNKWSSCNVW